LAFGELLGLAAALDLGLGEDLAFGEAAAGRRRTLGDSTKVREDEHDDGEPAIGSIKGCGSLKVVQANLK